MAGTPWTAFSDATALEAGDIGLLQRGAGGMNFAFALLVHKQSDGRFKADGALDVAGNAISTATRATGAVSGGAGGAVELQYVAGTAFVQGYNRTTDGFTNLHLRGDSVTITFGAAASVGLVIDSGGVKPMTGTTASAGNVYQASSGAALLRSTSSERYKRDIQPVTREAALRALEVPVVRYRSDPELCPADNPAWSHYGVSAEAAAAIDPRFVHFAHQDDQYETVEIEPARAEVRGENDAVIEPAAGAVHARRVKAGEAKRPDGAQYERLTLLRTEALRILVEEQAALIAAMAARLAALEGKG